MCENRLAGTWMGWMGAEGCEVTLPLLQGEGAGDNGKRNSMSATIMSRLAMWQM
jgi:hypothetical protein